MAEEDGFFDWWPSGQERTAWKNDANRWLHQNIRRYGGPHLYASLFGSEAGELGAGQPARGGLLEGAAELTPGADMRDMLQGSDQLMTGLLEADPYDMVAGGGLLGAATLGTMIPGSVSGYDDVTRGIARARKVAQGPEMTPSRFAYQRQQYRLPGVDVGDLGVGGGPMLYGGPDPDKMARELAQDAFGGRWNDELADQWNDLLVREVRSKRRRKGIFDRVRRMGDELGIDRNALEEQLRTLEETTAERRQRIATNFRRGQESTPAFKQWFKESAVKDSEGYPRVVYHGTLSDFDTHQKVAEWHGDGFFGGGFYFTDTPSDAAGSYANTQGPDVLARIGNIADEMAHADYDGIEKSELLSDALELWKRDELSSFPEDLDSLTSEDWYQLALHRNSDMAPNIQPVYLSMQNPVVFTDGPGPLGRGMTFFDYNYEFDDEIGDLVVDPTGKLADFLETLREVGEEWDVSPTELDEVSSALLQQGIEEGGVGARDLFVTANHGIHAYSPDTGDYQTSEFVREVFERMGFDGIVDEQAGPRWAGSLPGVEPNTTHYIVFEPEQIKSATGNRGTFSPDDPSIVRGLLPPLAIGGAITGGLLGSDEAEAETVGPQVPTDW